MSEPAPREASVQEYATTVAAVVLGGYLGAGKTTLVNHLLRHADGRRIAVLVNDFGEISIDADLIVGAEGGVLSLAGGCVCCSFGSDLVDTLRAVLQRDPAPQVVLIETSGVGIPSAVVAAARLVPNLRVEATVVVADAQTVQEGAADRYVGDTVRRQLADADLLVLNKADLLVADRLHAVHEWLARAHPATPVWRAERARVPPEAVLGLSFAEAAPDAAGLQPRSLVQRPPSADAVFESGLWTYGSSVDVDAVLADWASQAPSLVRAKGFVRDLEGRTVCVQWSGRRGQVEVLRSPPASGVLGRVAWIRLKSVR